MLVKNIEHTNIITLIIRNNYTSVIWGDVCYISNITAQKYSPNITTHLTADDFPYSDFKPAVVLQGA